MYGRCPGSRWHAGTTDRRYELREADSVPRACAARRCRARERAREKEREREREANRVSVRVDDAARRIPSHSLRLSLSLSLSLVLLLVRKRTGGFSALLAVCT